MTVEDSGDLMRPSNTSRSLASVQGDSQCTHARSTAARCTSTFAHSPLEHIEALAKINFRAKQMQPLGAVDESNTETSFSFRVGLGGSVVAAAPTKSLPRQEQDRQVQHHRVH